MEVHYNGSELYLLVANPTTHLDIFIEEQIKYAIQDAIDRLIDLQDQDPYIDDDEKLEEIRHLRVKKVGDFTYSFYFLAVTVSDEQVERSFAIELSQQMPDNVRKTYTQVFPEAKGGFSVFK